jgi:hypothetical protein
MNQLYYNFILISFKQFTYLIRADILLIFIKYKLWRSCLYYFILTNKKEKKYMALFYI